MGLRDWNEPMDGPDVAVLLVDDQATFRAVLRDLVEHIAGFVLVGEASSGEEATVAVARLSPQLVLMDVAMAGIGGIAAARAILSRRDAPVIVLTSADDPALHPELVSLGDRVAYLRKQDLRPLRLKQLYDARRN